MNTLFNSNNNSMKALSIASIYLSIFISTSSSAALSGSIVLSGTVPKIVSIAVSSLAGYNALDLVAGKVDEQVASINEKSNVTTGYVVTMSSANAGFLKQVISGVTVASVAYTAKYNGSASALQVAPLTLTSVSNQAAIVNTNKILSVSIPADSAGALLSGTYSDTLTFTIAAN